MKKVFLRLVLLIGCGLQARGEDSSSYLFQDKSKLSHEYKSAGASSLNKLVFVSGEKVIVLHERQSLERVLVNGDFTDKFYEKSEIVTAEQNKDVIVVVFRLSPGHQTLNPIHTKNYGYAPVTISENDYLIKSFVRSKSNEAWEPHLNFYPQTLFGDTVDQSIKSISILDKDHYRINYSGSWAIIGGESAAGDTRKKSFKEKGETLKEVKFDPVNKLLLGLSGEKKSYSKTFIWWSPYYKITCGKDFQAHRNEHVDKVAELGIPLIDFEYFARLGPEEQVDPLENLLNERLEK
jgi:hypothetical protein